MHTGPRGAVHFELGADFERTARMFPVTWHLYHIPRSLLGYQIGLKLDCLMQMSFRAMPTDVPRS